MADVDEDGTGEIEFAEFLRAFEKQRGGAQETVLGLFSALSVAVFLHGLHLFSAVLAPVFPWFSRVFTMFSLTFRGRSWKMSSTPSTPSWRSVASPIRRATSIPSG